MNKIQKTALILALLVVLVFAQDESIPIIEVAEPAHDFNLVQQNTVLEHRFKIRNVGTDTLKILKVRPG